MLARKHMKTKTRRNKSKHKEINTTSKIINILHVGRIFCGCGLDFSKNKANFAQFEGNH